MPVDLLRHMLHVIDELRFRSTLKHIRVLLDGQPVADSLHAVLVWEPYRIVPDRGRQASTSPSHALVFAQARPVRRASAR